MVIPLNKDIPTGDIFGWGAKYLGGKNNLGTKDLRGKSSREQKTGGGGGGRQKTRGQRTGGQKTRGQKTGGGGAKDLEPLGQCRSSSQMCHHPSHVGHHRC